MLERSLEMLIGLLAVWKAGAAYIPLDPTHPAERLDYILGDAGAEWLLTNSSCQFRTGTIRAIKVDVEEALIRRQPIAKPEVASAPDNLAYVIYTSGSTGDPKGVQITHRNLTHFLCSVAQRPGCTSDDYMLAWHDDLLRHCGPGTFPAARHRRSSGNFAGGGSRKWAPT